ncbi:hypothetical protein SLEP1_g46819 [Rubroshorea leprosula]|uniref:Uncharacterized protein n=1 Tax=Rubroshorea leprosula TaxID=152421 RepID=A0AAV5LQA6_9ROSI|nr:hypothetical protein SLEP1_g46819 [Rubroshorea leprosula]
MWRWRKVFKEQHSLISLGAAPGALTDQSPEYPSGRTPADLAFVNGHKGIAGYLADRFLDIHISSINLDHQDDAAGRKAVQKISETSAAPLSLRNASEVGLAGRGRPNLGKELEEEKEEDKGPEDEGPEGNGQKDEEPEKEKEEGKKRAPDSALESGKANKILKAYLAYMALLTAYYNVQSMVTNPNACVGIF